MAKPPRHHVPLWRQRQAQATLACIRAFITVSRFVCNNIHNSSGKKKKTQEARRKTTSTGNAKRSAPKWELTATVSLEPACELALSYAPVA